MSKQAELWAGTLSERANRTALSMTGREDRVVTRLLLSKIKRDGGTQPRAGLNADVVTEYQEVLANGGALPAVEVVYDGTEYWLWDGYHRLAAAEQENETEYDCYVTSGTRRDAVLLSVGANAEHGYRRTNEDKRRAVETLLNDAEWSQWSDREIARQCKVSHSLVSSVRDEMTGRFCQSGKKKASKRVGADGREYDVTNVRAANQRRAEEERARKDAEVTRWRAVILSALRDSPKRSLALVTAVGLDVASPPPAEYTSARNALVVEGLVRQEATPRGEVTFRLAEKAGSLGEQVAEAEPQPPAQAQARLWADEREALVATLRAGILEKLAAGPLRYIELLAALDNPPTELLRTARDQLKAEGQIVEEIGENHRVSFRLAKPRAAAEPETRTEREAPPLDEAVTVTEEGPDVSDLDADMAERLSEMLRAGEMVAGHLERVLNRPEPIPNWLLIKMNELQGLLHGRTDRIDVYFPGLNQLLDDLYTKHFEEEKSDQNPGF